MLPEAGSAHVEELSDPYLLWFWNSNVRSTAIVLNSLVGAAAGRTRRSRPMVRWLMARPQERPLGQHAGERARDGSARRLLPQVRDRRCRTSPAVAMLGDRRARARAVQGPLDRGDGRATMPMPQAARVGAGRASTQPLTFTRDGTGTLFYTTRLRYAADELFQQGLDSGFRIERRYAPYVENGTPPGGDHLQGRRSRPRHADAPPDEGAPLRRRHRSAAGRLRAGRVVVRDDGRGRSPRSRIAARTTAEPTWESWWQRGGFDHVERHDDRVQLFATRLGEGRHAVQLRRPRDDGRDVPDGAGARRGDVRAGGLRPHGDGGDRRCSDEGVTDLRG